MYCYLIAKTVDITRFFPKSYKNTRTIVKASKTLVFGAFSYYSSLFAGRKKDKMWEGQQKGQQINHFEGD